MSLMRSTFVLFLVAAPVCAQVTDDPFPSPIPASEGVIRVGYTEFARVPDFDGEPARMMLMSDEPGTGRLFVSDMRGRLYTVSYDGRTVGLYLDLDDRRWAIGVTSSSSETGFQSFAFHPQFAQQGTPGYGKLYTWTDVADKEPAPDFTPGGGQDSHDTVLQEWTARNAGAATYDGGAPRTLLRIEQPFRNHNGGQVAFNPVANPGDADFGKLYVGVADGGSGGDPLDLAQNLGSIFGKVLRLDPLGSNSANGRYGIPADNPFVGRAGALGEIFAYGVRNPGRFGWDPANGNMYLADIGQGTVEELSPVTSGANLGWNDWEGSFRFASRAEVDRANARGDRSFTYPVAEYGQVDPLLQRQSAATGVIVYRATTIPQLTGRILFGDNPSGEVFHVSADDPPRGGQDQVRRVLLNDDGAAKTLLQLIQEKNVEQGRTLATRADLRFGWGPGGQVFLLNKRDGVIRMLTR
jgi:hypothetical protein